MKKDRNILLIVGLVAGVIMFGIAGFFLYRGIIQFNIEEEKLAKAKADLDKIYAQEPFPSDKNRKIEQGNADTLRMLNSNMVDRMSRAQIEPDKLMTPSAFKNLLRDKQHEFVKLAKDAGVVVAKDFAFGFQKYTMGGEMPRVEDVPRLAQQLKITEELLEVLYASKIKELVSMDRDEFDSLLTEANVLTPTSTADASARGSRGRSARQPRGGGPADENSDTASGVSTVKPKDAGIIPPAEQSSSLHFRFEVKVKEDTLMSLLNKIAGHEMFVTVSQIAIPKIDVPKVSLPGKKPADEAQEDPMANVLAGAAAVGSDTNTVAVKMDDRNRSSRMVCGPSIEKFFPVKIEVNVFRFRHAQEGVKGAR